MPAIEVKLRRGTSSQHAGFAGAAGEVTVDQTINTLVVHDGVTTGGFPLARQDLSNIAGLATDLIPAADNAYDLGSPDRRWRDIYVSANTIHLGTSTTLSGNRIAIEPDANPTSLAEMPTLVASKIVAKPYSYNPGGGSVTARPSIEFQDALGNSYPISFNTATNEFSLDALGDHGTGSLVARKLTLSNGGATALSLTGHLSHDGNYSNTTTSNTFRFDGNVTLGLDATRTLTVKAATDFQGGLSITGASSFKGAVTLGDGNDTVAVNAGAANPFTVTSSSLTVTSGGNVTVPGNLAVSGTLTVSGAVTEIASNQVNIGDNLLVLNADLPGTQDPTEDAGLQIARGTEAASKWIWNETSDFWSPAGGNIGNVGTLTAASLVGPLTGNASTASKLAASVTINGTAFDGSGSITVADATKLPTAGGTMTGPITLAGDPTAELHAVPRQWVESRMAKDNCRVATTTDLGYATSTTTTITGKAATYVTNGTTTESSVSVTGVTNAATAIQVGAGVTGTGIPASTTVAAVSGTTVTLSNPATASATVSLTFTNTITGLIVDGITLATGDRLLVKSQITGSRNGIYTVTNTGSASVPWVLTRATDADTWAKLAGALTGVEAGTNNDGTLWYCTNNPQTGILGSTTISWQVASNPQVAAIGSLAGTGFVQRTGAATFTVTPAASANTASALVQRDASGDFSANDITANDFVFPIGGTHIIGSAATGGGHLAGNVGSVGLSIDDGGGPSGVFVNNTRTGSFNSQDITFKTAEGSVSLATERMKISSDGNVFIGFSSYTPVTSGVRAVQLKGPNTASGYSVMQVECGLNTKQAMFQIFGANGDVEVGTQGGNTTGKLGLRAGGSERLVISADGDVVIGASTPNSNTTGFRTLHVAGTTRGGVIELTDSSGTLHGRFFSDATNGTVTLANNHATGPLTFTVAAAERGRWLATGELLIGTTGLLASGLAPTPGALTARHVGGVRHALRLEASGTTNAAQAIFVNDNGAVGSISTSGSTTAYNTTSDYRLKQDVQPLTNALDRLSLLKPSRFAFKADPSVRLDGFLAHEVDPICPEAIQGEHDGVDFGGNPQYQSMDAAKLIPLLTAALQEAVARISDLTARVETLEAAV